MTKLKALYILHDRSYEIIYGAPEREAIAELVDIIGPQMTADTLRQSLDRVAVSEAGEAPNDDEEPTITLAAARENLSLLADVEAIISGWGMLRLDEDVLAAAPNLKIVFYGAGSIRSFTTEASWDRGIIVTSAYAANAVPVSEYALSQILFSLKRGWHFALKIKAEQQWVRKTPVAGAFDSTVGLISLGMIGRLMIERLKPFDINIIAYDPFVSAEQGAALGVEMVSLDEVFQRADVVSLHTPKLPSTLGMITGEHIAMMKRGATFLNTARGAVVREPEMIEVLQQRPDLFAILDVTHPEPPVQGSPLYTLPNVILTPHIAGSMDQECRRMGQYAVEDIKHYLAGEPLTWGIDRERAKILA